MPNSNTTKEISYWNEEASKCRTLREPFERQWYLNLAFFAGKQYMMWTPQQSADLSRQRLMEPPAPRYRVRLVDNKIRPIVRTEVAKLTQSEAQFYCTPSTSEPTDVIAAHVSELIATYVTRESKYNAARRRATFWLSICGVGFISTYIDPNTQKLCNIMFDDVTPFHLLVPNIQAADIESQPYVIRERLIDPDIVEETYGVRPNPTSGLTDQRFLQALGIKNQGAASQLSCVRDVWVKPCKNYKDGAFLVMVDDRVIYAAEAKPKDPLVQQLVDPNLDMVINPEKYQFTESAYPYAHKEFPFAKIEHVQSGGFYCSSVVEDLIPLQRAFNRSRSQQLEIQNRTANPPLFFHRGSIDPNKMTTEPGLQVPVQPGFDFPTYGRPGDLPGFIPASDDRLLQSMEDISGQHEITRGRTPPGVEAASAISYLQEQEDSKLHTTVASIEEATAKTGKHVLALAQQYWPPAKIAEVVSKASSADLVYFQKASTIDSTDIAVESNSMAPRSLAAKRAFIMELIQGGVISPDQGLRYLEMNETNRLFEEMQVDSKQARRENIRMAKGEDVPVNPWDNNPIHNYEHGLFMKSQEFETMAKDAQLRIVKHWQMHQTQQLGDSYASGGSPGMGSPDNNPIGNGISQPITTTATDATAGS